MIIESITLQDLGVYAGRQTLDLRTQSKQKPIILIGALNGSGKTTLLDSIQLCLYGRNAKTASRGKLRYSEYLVESIHRHNGASSAAVEIVFRQRRNGLEHTFKVARSWKRNETGGCKEYFVVEKDGQLDQVATENWDEHVNRFLPRQIAPLFFFDGEKVEEYADPDKAPILIQTAIHGLLGLDTVDQLETDLVTLERRKIREELGQQERDSLERAEQAAISVLQELDKMKQDIANIKTNLLPDAEKHAENIEAEFKKKGGQLYLRRTEISASLNEAKGALSSTKEDMLSVAGDISPLLINDDMIQRLGSELDHTEEVLEAAATQQILTTRNSDLLSFLNNLTLTEADVKTTERYLASEIEQLQQKASEEASLIPEAGTTEAIRLYNEQVKESTSSRIKKLRNSYALQKSRVERLESELEGVPTEDSISELLEAKKAAEIAVVKLKSEVADAQEHVARLTLESERSKATLTRLYEETAQHQQAAEDSKRVIEHSQKSRKTLEKFRAAVIAKHLANIEHIVHDSFANLTRKNSLIAKIEIDPANYVVKLIDQDGHQFSAQRLSAGERQLLSIAMLWGLAKASGRPLPTIIDTPLGRLDGSHRDKLISQYFPFASHQVILLSTDEEIGLQEHRKLSEFIGNEVTLTFDDAKKSTTVQSGYMPQLQELQHVS